jgi:hypothetical protein
VARSAASAAALACVLIPTALGLLPDELSGQQRPTPQQDIPGIPPPLPVSPGGAFARALLLPGWGHAAIGSYVRGGVYFAAQGTTLYTYARTRGRLNETRKSVRFRETVLIRELAKEGVTDPDEIDARLAEDPLLSELNVLLDSRESQQEDLIAFSLFLVLISSADAYVTAHLSRFPDPLEVDAAPSPTGGIDLAVKVALPN